MISGGKRIPAIRSDFFPVGANGTMYSASLQSRTMVLRAYPRHHLHGGNLWRARQSCSGTRSTRC
jgi:hypothetical protein